MTSARTTQLSYSLAEPTKPTDAFHSVLMQAQSNSDFWSSKTTKKQSLQLGQVFTPYAMAAQLSSLLPESSIPTDFCTLADPGCGTGILSVAMASKVASSEKTPEMLIRGFEKDERLKDSWAQVWDMFEKRCEQSVDVELHNDFTADAEKLLKTGQISGITKPRIIQTNPPYKKLDKNSALSKVMTANGIPVPNLYAVFIALSASWLEEGGELLAIIPRSFASGDYFKKFRAWLNSRMSVEHVVLYRSRSNFKNVLQETILIRLKKTPKQNMNVRLTVMDTPTSTPEFDLVMPAESIITNDGWWMPRSEQDIKLVNKNRNRKDSLESLGVSMSTGKVEMHRLRGERVASVLYATDMDNEGNVTWGENRKPREVNVVERQVLSLPEDGCYVALKRIASNDEKKSDSNKPTQRLFPVLLTRSTTGLKELAIENHVQYLHSNNQPLSLELGRKLVEALSSNEHNAVIRSIGGTTQVNRSDLNQLRF
ncbi:Eco57I restriction-modification methylase domain-containing protein [Vibrio sp. 10N.239.312.D08]|uniref:Eco57I restriction-modification methylase domain-containing protein n=1 Tax=Vibrio sp. 10N.239.312.D08 TaxID=3229978 RepID=UPI003553146D